MWYENPQLAKRVLAKYSKENDPVMLEKTYEFFTKQAGFNRDLTFTDRGFEQILKFLGGTILPAAKRRPGKSVLRCEISSASETNAANTATRMVGADGAITAIPRNTKSAHKVSPA